MTRDIIIKLTSINNPSLVIQIRRVIKISFSQCVNRVNLTAVTRIVPTLNHSSLFGMSNTQSVSFKP